MKRRIVDAVKELHIKVEVREKDGRFFAWYVQWTPDLEGMQDIEELYRYYTRGSAHTSAPSLNEW